MARSIEDYLNEANDIIEKRASAPAQKPPSDDEIVKLADILTAQEAPPPPPQLELTLFEKVAYSMAIIDTVRHIEEFQKIDAFEKTARERGFSDEQVAQFLEKRAEGPSALSKVLATGGALGLAGFAHIHGKKRGKEEGYEQAMSDIQHALQQE
jgi:hypothetical protein